MSDFRLDDDDGRAPKPTPLPPSFPPPGTPGSSTPPRVRRPVPKGRVSFPWPLLLLLSLAPIGLATWILLMPGERRRKAFEAIPSGSGGRAIAAGAALVLLLVLVYLVLPATRTALHALMRGYHWFFRRRGPARILLAPVQFFVWLGWFLMQVVFAIDAVLVVATGIALILMAVRIMKPELFPWLPG
jgi:hypothetical protein